MNLNLMPIQFEDMLIAISKEWSMSEAAREQFLSVGINPKHWPEIKAKELLVTFEESVLVKDYKWARMMMVDSFSKLQTSYTLQEEVDEIKMIYQHNIKLVRAKKLSQELARRPQDCDEILHRHLSDKPMEVKLYDVSAEIENVIRQNEKMIKEKRSKVILPDFKILSDMIGGFNPKRVSLVSAISGFGKTKLAVNFALSASKIMPVLYFNMEMGIEDFIALFIHRECGIKNTWWYDGSYLNEHNAGRIKSAMNMLSQRNIKVTDGKSLTIDQICSVILTQAKQHDSCFIIIDYDQKISSQGFEHEWMGILKSVEKLEDVAKSCNAQILILAQADESGDLKASKRAKQPASAVLNFTKNDNDEYVIRSIKNRFGPNDFEVIVSYDPATTTISEMSLGEKRIAATPNDRAIKTFNKITGRGF